MFDWIIKQTGVYKDLKEELKSRTQYAAELQKRVYNTDKLSMKAVESVIKRGIHWYDYEALGGEQRLAYYQNAQSILNNEVIQNELKAYSNDLMTDIACKSEDYDKVRDLRMSMNGAQTLIERIGDITPVPEEEPSKEPHASI